MGAAGLEMQVKFQPQGTAYPTYMYHVGQHIFLVYHKDLIILRGQYQYHVCWWPADPTSHPVWKLEYSRTPRLMSLLLMLWFLHHQPIITCDVNDAGQSSPSCWKILSFACNFLMAFETWMILSYVRQNQFHFSLFDIKNISFGYIYWMQRVFSQYCLCSCAGALSSMPKTDQDQMDPLRVSILKLKISKQRAMRHMHIYLYYL